MLDFPDHGPTAAAILCAAHMEIVTHEDVSARLPSEHKYHTVKHAKDLPQCVQSCWKSGLFRESTRNPMTVHLSLMLKSLGIDQGAALSWMEEWAERIPEELTGTRVKGRVQAVHQTLRWAYRKPGTSANCKIMRELGCSCPGESQCPVVTWSKPEESGDEIDVTMEEAVSAPFVGRPIRFKATVMAVDTTPQVLPSQLSFSCAPHPGNEVCKSCTWLEKKQGDLQLTDKRILRLATLPDEGNFPKWFDQWLKVPKKCPGHRVEATTRTPLLMTLCQPANLNGTPEKTRENTVLVKQTAIDDQRSYSFKGITYPHPKTHRALSVARSAVPIQGMHERFEMTEVVARRLQAFQAADNTAPAIMHQIDRIQTDIMNHVCKVYGRILHQTMASLVFHSPLQFRFRGQAVKGTLDALFMGDTAQGKSEIVNRLIEYYRCGRSVNGESLTLVGLTAGVDKIEGRNVMRKGVLPREDGRLVFIDEFGGCSPEIIGALSDARSLQKVRPNKIVSAEFPARVRLILGANPVFKKTRFSCEMSDLAYGVMHVLPLMVNPEDVRRLDFVVGFTKSDATHEMIHRVREEVGPQRFSSDLASLLIQWVWSRTIDQVVFTKEAEDACLSISEQFSGTEGYSESIPLCSSGDMRYKVARLGASVAGMVFSSDESAKTLVVTPEHVDVAALLLKQLYNGPELQFDIYSAADPRHQRLTFEDFIAAVGDISLYGTEKRYVHDEWKTEVKWDQALRVMLVNTITNRDDLQSMAGLEDTKNFFASLTRRGMLQKAPGGFKLNSKGVKCAKLMLSWVAQGKGNVVNITEQWFLENLRSV